MSGAGHNRLFALADDIRTLHRAIRRNAEQIARDALEAGRCLIEAKELLQHGQWETWLRDHVAIAPRTARAYMRLARSGLEIGTLADLGLAAATRLISSDSEDQEPPVTPVIADLPLCLTAPPEPGQAFSFVGGVPRRWVIMWESSEHPGFYFVVAMGVDDCIAETLRRPVAWAGINMVLRHMHIYLDDKCEVERKPCDRSLLEDTRRWLAGQEPGWQKREWHGDSAGDEGDEEVGGTLAEPTGVA